MQNSFRDSGFLGNLTPVVKNLLIINVMMFGATFILEQKGTDLNGMLGLYYFDSPRFAVYQIITHLFMHGSFLHLAFNMFALVMFGSLIEDRWGSKKFLLYYLLTGLGSAALYTLSNAVELQMLTGSISNDLNTLRVTAENAPAVGAIYYSPCIGASGAVFGILAAFAFLFPDAPLGIMFIPVPIKAKYLVLGYAVIELVLGFTRLPGDNIAHFAHIGGAITGFLLLLYWKSRGKLWARW